MFFDSHIHTQFSSDSTMQLTQAFAKAEQLGIGIITTEHMDLNYPEAGKFIFPVDAYWTAYERMRGDNLLLGIELGMRVDCAAENASIAKQAPFDYVLGSTHMVGEHDLYFPAFYEGLTKEATYAKYLQTMYDCVQTHLFVDALAHIDYIARYAPYADPELYYHEFADHIDAVLRLIIDNEIALELNTRRLDVPSVQKAMLPLYKRYRRLGGSLLTLGSDAHTPEAIGNNFAIAQALADSCDLQLVYFKERKMIKMDK